MAVKTNNIYGKILITNRTIEHFILHVGMDCYGIAAIKDVKVRSMGDRIFIDVSVGVKYGVSIIAVVEALKESLKYKVERFTGMIVDTINVKVMGVKK